MICRALPVFLLFSLPLFPQSTATLQGTIFDPYDAAISEAHVTLENRLTGFERAVASLPDGGFTIANIPFNNYVLRIVKPGFAGETQQIPLRSNIPVNLTIRMRLGEHLEAITVGASDSAILVEPEATGTRTELNAAAIERLPAAIGTRGLEAALLSFPGFAADANGAIHPRGAHNQMTYVIDGMAISDQLTGAFGATVDPSVVQTLELYTGNVPAEFGSKVSGVANITTRSGLDLGRRFSGSAEFGAAQFGALTQTTHLTGGSDRFGYFASFTALKTHRFLDQVSLENLHNGGNAERAFARFDYRASPRDSLRFNVLSGRSSFELANLPSQHAAGQDQRQLLRDLAGSVGWLRTIDARTTFDAIASYRTSIAQLFPSPGDTPVTAAQARHLSTLNLAARFNRVLGAHVLRVGADSQYFPVSENFSFAVTDPAFLPALYGRPFHFSKKKAGAMYSGFAQDQVRWDRFTFSLGLRYDDYRFLVDGHQLQPRLGVSFHLRETGTVFRASYNRNYQTPVNENLLLSNSTEAGVLVSPLVRAALGSELIRIRPQRQNVYEAGVQQAAGGRVSLSAVYYHKDERDLHDNDNFFNTGIIFPTSLARSRVNGAELRAAILPIAGFSGSVAATHYHAVVTPPFTGGLFVGSTALDLLTSGPFAIDHDQALGAQANLHYAAPKNIWLSGVIRYDSGLVSNPSDPAEVARDPDFAGLLPYVNLASDPPRVRPRTIVDLAIGYERPSDERRRWEVRFQISNLTNKTALYNFQSIFVGTRLVQPRTAGAAVKLRW
jgi:TonB dependent receptor/Carboxypeptidase regulatory-like domain